MATSATEVATLCHKQNRTHDATTLPGSASPFAYGRAASYAAIGVGAIIGAVSPSVGFTALLAGVAGLFATAVGAHRAHA
jgi:sulfite exporter TauE/SafE